MKRDQVDSAAPAALDAIIRVPARLFFSVIEQALVREDILGDFRRVPEYLSRHADESGLPPIGSDFDGGKFAGLTLHEGRVMALVLHDGETGPCTWADAKKWAEEQGQQLPTRQDALVLWQNREALNAGFKPEYYWTSEVAAHAASSAFFQSFDDGDQRWDWQASKYRARAVRRVPL